MTNNKIYGLEPIVFPSSKILILGTLPGKKSLQFQMYYSDRGNYFWKFISMYLDEEFPNSKKAKLDMLEKTGIALWDIYKSGVRIDRRQVATSNDKDIVEYELNDLRAFIKKNPQIIKIGVAGDLAYKSFCKYYADIEAYKLPSTSGSNGGQWGNKNIQECIDINRKGWQEWHKFLTNV